MPFGVFRQHVQIFAKHQNREDSKRETTAVGSKTPFVLDLHLEIIK